MHDRYSRVLFPLLPILFLQIGCGRDSTPANDQSKTETSIRLESAREIKSEMTLSKCLDFAKLVDSHFESGDLNQLDKLTDWNAFLDTIMSGIPNSNRVYNGYRKRFLERARGDGGLFRQMCSDIKSGALYEMLRARQSNGQWKILYRLIMPDDRVNYFEFVLQTDPSGQVRAIDLFLFSSGALFSEIMRPTPLMYAVQEEPSLIDKFNSTEQLQIKHYKILRELSLAVQNETADKAIDIYHSLPATLRSHKLVVVPWLIAAMSTRREDEATDALLLIKKEFNNERWTHLIALFHHYGREEFTLAMNSLELLDKAVGGDPYLNFSRSAIHLETGNLTKANELCDLLIVDYPDLLNPYWLKLSIALEGGNHAESLKWMKTINESSDVEWGDLQEDEAYAEFVKSPHYQNWQKHLEQN